MTKPSVKPEPKTERARTIVTKQVISRPGAQVTETVFKLSKDAAKQLRIHVNFPPAQKK